MKDNLVQEQETLKNGDENGPLEPESERKIGSSQGDSAELGLKVVQNMILKLHDSFFYGFCVQYSAHGFLSGQFWQLFSFLNRS